MPVEKPCFLCGSQAQVHVDLKIYEVECVTCGTYIVTRQVVYEKLESEYRDRKHLLTASTRLASDAGRHLTITTENLSSLLDSIPSSMTPLESLDRALLLVRQKQIRADQFVELKFTDYPLVFARDGQELKYFVETLVHQGLLEKAGQALGPFGSMRLTPSGWQRVVELQKTQRRSNQAFVAMWFTTGLKEAYGQGFKPALEETGFHPYRVDLDEHNEKIDDRIVAEIRRSGLLVADFTGHRGGVYFEAGFAMGLGIPVIWTCRQTDIDGAHFDTRQYNHIVWTDPADIKSQLALRIRATVPGR